MQQECGWGTLAGMDAAASDREDCTVELHAAEERAREYTRTARSDAWEGGEKGRKRWRRRETDRGCVQCARQLCVGRGCKWVTCVACPRTATRVRPSVGSRPVLPRILCLSRARSSTSLEAANIPLRPVPPCGCNEQADELGRSRDSFLFFLFVHDTFMWRNWKRGVGKSTSASCRFPRSHSRGTGNRVTVGCGQTKAACAAGVATVPFCKGESGNGQSKLR